jgi:hypothetical protein
VFNDIGALELVTLVVLAVLIFGPDKLPKVIQDVSRFVRKGLLRDLSDPRLWIERYETPTWLDYIRLNNRPTQDDASIPERLRALHRGTQSPQVRRRIERQTSSPPTPGPGTEEATTDL